MASKSNKPFYVLEEERPKSGLHFSVARNLDQVLEAWQVVYQAYQGEGLIDPNPFELHTMFEAIGPHSVVVLGCLGPVPVNTISAYTDGPHGLPLDSVYKAQLDELRAAGRKLVEVGLFADRREHLNRAADGVFDLMRYGFFYAKHTGADDIVIGVHPRHYPFYRRLFAFDKIGDEREYPTVNNNPVISLRLDLTRKLALDPLPKGLQYFADHPVPAEEYEGRYSFEKDAVEQSPIASLLSLKRHKIAV